MQQQPITGGMPATAETLAAADTLAAAETQDTAECQKQLGSRSKLKIHEEQGDSEIKLFLYKNVNRKEKSLNRRLHPRIYWSSHV